METITALQFQELLATTGKARNVKVIEPIQYGVPHPQMDAPPSDFEIINCDLSELFIAFSNVNTAKISKGTITKLVLGTGSTYKNVTITGVNIGDLTLDEMTSDQFTFHAVGLPTPIQGRTARIKKAVITGNIKKFFNPGIACGSLVLRNMEVETINLNGEIAEELTMENVRGGDFDLSYMGSFPKLIKLKMVDVASFKIFYGNQNEMMLKGAHKLFNLSTAS